MEMVPCDAKLAILVGDDRRPVSVAVVSSHNNKVLAKVAIKNVFAIVKQLEGLGHAAIEQEDRADRDT
jgi:hypothetical protein